MKNHQKIFIALAFCAVLLANIFAQSGGPYEIKKSVVANGGAQADGGVFSITGTIGQGAAGTYSGNRRYAMRAGFWTPASRASAANGKIVYTNGGDIWKMDPDGSNRQLVIDAGTNDIEPAWSPDGSKIAFKSDRAPSSNGGIWVVNADGTGLTLLTYDPSYGSAKPTWSPDGSKIAFASNRNGLISSIYIMNADGSNVARLTNQLPISDQGPEWSPDGTRMVFETNTGIAVINLDGTGRMDLGGGQFPSWSPDGTKIIFATIPPAESNFQLFVMNADGGARTQITFGNFNDQYPSFSPDGRKIVFARNTTGTIGLWTMNANGSGQVIFSGTNTIGNGYSDWQRAPNTPVAAPATLRIDEATITFANVLVEGNTTFTPITPTQGQLPPGFALCPTCPAYDIVTTADYTPPVTVCLQVPSMTNMATFTALKLFHNEGGVLVNRTSGRDFATRVVCATVSSLSPFVLAEDLAPTAANVSVSGRVLTAHGQGIRNARVTLTNSNGVARNSITGTFGYFRFDDVPGQTYIVSVRSKRFQFTNNAQVLSVNDEITDLTFTALPE